MKKTLRPFLLAAALLCQLACTQAQQQTAIIPTLPQSRQYAPHTVMPLGDAWVGFVHHRNGDTYSLEIALDRDELPAGHSVELQLIGTPYSTASGNKWAQSIGRVHSVGTHRFTLSEQDFRKNGGPYDYSIHFSLCNKSGKEVAQQDMRLNNNIPGPGWPSYHEQENSEQLSKLQEAAKQCKSMRLLLVYHHEAPAAISHTTPTVLPLIREDIARLRELIFRMQPVKTYLHHVTYAYNLELHLLGENGEKLAVISPSDVTAARYVSPEGVADMSSYSLSNEDAAAWFAIFHNPAMHKAIKQAVESSRKRK